MSLGHKGSGNPASILPSLMNKRGKLQDDLRNIEKQVYELETNYLQDSSHSIHVLKGFEGFLSSAKNTANLKRSRKFLPEEDCFLCHQSLHQRPKNSEFDRMMEDMIPAQLGLGGGGLGQGKPKKGRTASSARDEKRTRPSNAQDFDDEDDPDTSLR